MQAAARLSIGAPLQQGRTSSAHKASPWCVRQLHRSLSRPPSPAFTARDDIGMASAIPITSEHSASPSTTRAWLPDRAGHGQRRPHRI